MDQLTISAKARTLKGRKTDALRGEGAIPAVVYGFNTEPTNITVDRNEMERLYQTAGESTVVALEVEGKTVNVLLQDYQRDALTSFLTHVDFRAIDMSQKVEAVITLKLVGEAPAVKELGGTLVESIDEVEVSALPSALVREIEIDISTLKTFEDAIHVSDIKVPAGIEILTEGDVTIASVQPPRSEAEMAALDGAVEENVESVQVTTEKKEEAPAAE